MEHAKALKQAATKAMELEAARCSIPQAPPIAATNVDDAALKASTLLEKAFTDLYKRIQDQGDKDDHWKATCMDRLENVSFVSRLLCHTFES